MRWSQIIFLAYVLVTGALHVFARPINLEVAVDRHLLDDDLDASGTQFYARVIHTPSIKDSSRKIRKKALRRGYMHAKVDGHPGVVKKKITKMPSGNYHTGTNADHILEAQTVTHALKQAGHHSLTPEQEAAVKKALNHPRNLVHVYSPINNEKNHFTQKGLKNPHATQDLSTQTHLKDYLSKTRGNGMRTAIAVDKALRKTGIHDVNVHGTHKQLLLNAGITRVKRKNAPQ